MGFKFVLYFAFESFFLGETGSCLYLSNLSSYIYNSDMSPSIIHPFSKYLLIDMFIFTIAFCYCDLLESWCKVPLSCHLVVIASRHAKLLILSLYPPPSFFINTTSLNVVSVILNTSENLLLVGQYQRSSLWGNLQRTYRIGRMAAWIINVVFMVQHSFWVFINN